VCEKWCGDPPHDGTTVALPNARQLEKSSCNLEGYGRRGRICCVQKEGHKRQMTAVGRMVSFHGFDSNTISIWNLFLKAVMKNHCSFPSILASVILFSVEFVLRFSLFHFIFDCLCCWVSAVFRSQCNTCCLPWQDDFPITTDMR